MRSARLGRGREKRPWGSNSEGLERETEAGASEGVGREGASGWASGRAAGVHTLWALPGPLSHALDGTGQRRPWPLC